MGNTFILTISPESTRDQSGGVDSIIQSPSLTWTYNLDVALDPSIENVSSLVGKSVTIANAANAIHDGTNTITAVDTSTKLWVRVVIAGSGGRDDEFSDSPATFFIPDVVVTNEIAKLA